MGYFGDYGTQIMKYAALVESAELNQGAAEGGMSYDPADFEKKYDDLPALLGRFDEIPQYDDFADMIGGSESLVEKLSRGMPPEGEYGEGLPAYANPALDLFDNVKDYVGDWQGQAAENFTEQFLNHAGTYSQNQFLVATVLRGALYCEREMWHNVALSVRSTCEETMKALEDYDGGGLSVAWTLGVLGTVIGATTGVGGVAFVTAALGVFSSAVTSEESTNSVESMIEKLREAVGKVEADVATEENKLIEILEANATYVEARRVQDFVGQPGAWDLVDADPGGARSPEVIGRPR